MVKSPHGERVDEYYWIRDDNPQQKRPEVLEHLRAEQAYTEAMLARLQPLEAQLLKEIRGRIQEDDSTAPQHDRGWWMWQAYREGGEHPVWMRRQGGVTGPERGAPEQVLLDGNELAKGHDYFRVSDVQVSPDGSRVAWTEDTQGRRGHELQIGRAHV